ncbi:Transmembrane protein [Phytophthora megakarya]|uniref:Transmembrane protein n=1 Tax=Phytophthora megakarya TaxID=4795 RepID=A0A225VWY8_9STRA|nr:Transmembrane protein [Phytophthora megakarya]
MAALADKETPGPRLIEFQSDPRDLRSVVSDEYGTFEVSMIEVESDFDDLHKSGLNLCERACYTCSEECLFVWVLLTAPFQVMTYKTMLFHVANFVFSVLALVCVVVLYTAKLPLSVAATCARRFRRFETWTLRQLLQLDCALFNFVSPPGERIMIYSPSIHVHQEEGLYGIYAQLYFGGVKLLATGVPGALAAIMFVWSLQNVFATTLRGSDPDGTSVNGHSLSASHELDVMTVVAIVAIYACVLLLHVFAFISRQFTIFFCSQYLLYAGGV